MDIVLVLGRLIHIFAAVVWAGSGFFSVMVLLPHLIRMGTDASKFMASLATNRGFAMIFPVSAGLTMLAGLYLYFRPGASGVFSSAGWAVLSIGALAGIAAGVHGGAVQGRVTGEYLQKVGSGTASPAEVTSLGDKMLLHGRISLILIIVALVGMASARYL